MHTLRDTHHTQNVRTYMRYLPTILLFILSCTNQQEDYRTLLEGTWAYEPVAWAGDTITMGFIDYFDDEPIEFAIRKLDSGIFLDVYVNDELRLSEECNYVWLTEFRFDSDTTGYLVDFVLDTASKQGRSELSIREYFTPRENRFLLNKSTSELNLITSDGFDTDTASIAIQPNKIELNHKPDEPTTLTKYKP